MTQDTTIYLNKDTTICLNGEEFKVILKMSNAEEYYHQAHDLHIEQLYSLRKQNKLLSDIIAIDSELQNLQQIIREGTEAEKELAIQNYNSLKKKQKVSVIKLKFWKTLAIIEGVAIVVIVSTGYILIFL